MPRLIDADALKQNAYTSYECASQPCKVVDVSDIDDAPTVQETIRCEDCKWFDISEPSGTVDPIFYKCKRKSRFVESDDFCKYGEARE